MTSFVEVLNVELSDPESHFDELIKFFFMFHDPTTKDMQGNDAGEFTITALWSYGKKRSIFYFIRILNGLSMEG